MRNAVAEEPRGKRKSKAPTWELIGECGVDSGQLMVCDPCYIRSEWKEKDFAPSPDTPKGEPSGEFSYDGCCQATLSAGSAGQLYYKLGHAGAGVVFSSGYGDGCYPVYARKNKEGRIVEVRIKMG